MISGQRLEEAARAIAMESEWKLPKTHPVRLRFVKAEKKPIGADAAWKDMDDEERGFYSAAPAGGIPAGSYLAEVLESIRDTRGEGDEQSTERDGHHARQQGVREEGGERAGERAHASSDTGVSSAARAAGAEGGLEAGDDGQGGSVPA